MDYIHPCLQKIGLSPRLRAAFSVSQEIVFLDYLNSDEEWVRQNVSFSFLKKINSRFLNLLDKQQFRLEMEGELVRVVSAEQHCYEMFEIVFEEINHEGNIDS